MARDALCESPTEVLSSTSHTSLSHDGVGSQSLAKLSRLFGRSGSIVVPDDSDRATKFDIVSEGKTGLFGGSCTHKQRYCVRVRPECVRQYTLSFPLDWTHRRWGMLLTKPTSGRPFCMISKADVGYRRTDLAIHLSSGSVILQRIGSSLFENYFTFSGRQYRWQQEVWYSTDRICVEKKSGLVVARMSESLMRKKLGTVKVYRSELQDLMVAMALAMSLWTTEFIADQ